MAYCLPKNLADKFVEGLRNGTINPNNLSVMTSEARRAFFQDQIGLGEIHSKYTNALFESKLLLKNQQRGMITWAKTVSGLKPEAKTAFINKVNNMTKILNPAEEKAFYSDLAEVRLGTKVTVKQANEIAKMAKTATDFETAMKQSTEWKNNVDKPTKAETERRMNYGLAKINFDNYVADLKTKAKGKISILSVPGIIAGASRGMRAAWDISFVGRQGVKSLLKAATGDLRSGQIWMETFGKSLSLFVSGKNGLDTLRAMIVSDPEYNMMRKAGISVGMVEEEIPVNIQNKIWVLGKIFEASENAYVGAAEFMRYKLAKTYFQIANNVGIDLTNKAQLEGIGAIVNNLTGRTSNKGKPGWENAVLWAPKLIKSNIDTLLFGLSMKGATTSFARTQAAISSARIIGGIAVMATVANLIHPGSVEWEDPTNSDFMKLKVGNQRIDFTGGMSAYVILAARMLTGKMTSPTTEVTKDLDSGKFGIGDRFDAIIDFFTNKTSPIGRLGVTYLKGQNYEGERIDRSKPVITDKVFLKEIVKLWIPLPAEKIAEYSKNKDTIIANKIAGIIAEEAGFSSNIYSYEVNWSQSTSAEMQQFRKLIGEVKFKKVEEETNKKFNNWLTLNLKNPKFIALSDDDRQKVITNKKNDFKKAIFKQYNYKYKAPKAKPLPNF